MPPRGKFDWREPSHAESWLKDDPDLIRVFWGGSRAEWLPGKVLEHSIYRHAGRPVRVVPLYEFDHWIRDDLREQGATNFSFQRFLVPEICQHRGRAIYLDSDMVVRADISELWDWPFPKDKKVLTCEGWQTAVTLFDCSCGWSWNKLQARLIKTHRRTSLLNYQGFPETSPCISGLWNVRDGNRVFKPHKLLNPNAKLIHFTHISRQPWLTDKHHQGVLWSNELCEAIRESYISQEDVMCEIEAGHVRPSLALVIGRTPPHPDSYFIPPHKKRAA